MNILNKELFSKFDTKEELHGFLHTCVNELKLPQQEPEGATKAVQDFFRERAISGNNPLPTALPDSLQSAIDLVFQIRYTDIVDAIVQEKLLSTGHNLLETIDWKVKWIMGSSKLANIREPICQLELICISKGTDLKPSRSSIHFECDLEKIDQLINALKATKSGLDKDEL